MTTTLETFKDQLTKLKACESAIEWVGDRTREQAWAECQRSDWMLWFLEYGEIEVSDKTYRLMAVRFAREVQHLMKDERSLKALDVAERYANGEATDDELAAERDAARDAARAAALAAARDAARDAARAAALAVAWDAAWAVAGAAALAAARAAALAVAWDAAWAVAGAKQADIIREFITL